MPQKYGPKRNSTRRKRGFPRRDKGKRHKHSEEYKQRVEAKRIAQLAEFERLKNDAWVKDRAAIPKSDDVLKRYVFIYNWFHRVYEWYKDKTIAMENTKQRFNVTEPTVTKAIKVVRYLNERSKTQNAQQ